MKPSCFATKVALMVSLFLLFITAGFSQSYRGRVQGVVTDQTQAVITSATVTLLNVGTGVSVVRQSSETGLFLFDLVDPGTYSLTVEATGFSKFIQQNIVVQMRGDVTVNAMLKPGALQESVTVSEAPVSVQFNSSNKDFTLDNKMANEVPRLDRNPFKLTLLAPSAVNTRGEMMPYHSWSANSVDLGGGTNLKNDLQVDGSPIGIGQKNSYPPNTDAVQEVVVSQNSVDAESGHSAGGLISLTLKSGSNDWHGSAFYTGRYPWLNAEADRTRFSKNATRQHMFGGTLGNAIVKNKLFNFFSLEDWKVRQPGSFNITVPTPLERAGDFSKTYGCPQGVPCTPENAKIKPIFDPDTTKLDPVTGAVTRTQFAGNVVPQSRFDPLSSQLAKSFWDPNNPGDDVTGVNNFRKGFVQTWSYYNFSDRVDYNINDSLKLYGRIGRYHTDETQPNPTPNNSELYVPTGSLRAATQISSDVVWTVNPRTVVNFHGDWHKIIDAYVSEEMDKDGWAKLWPGNDWYKPYQEASTGIPIYFPQLNIGGAGFGGRGFYWNQKPAGEAVSAKISQQRGSHFLKAGIEHRRSHGVTFVGNTNVFQFPNALTAETYNNPDTRLNGSQWATFLLGALDGSTQMIGGPAPSPKTEYWGMFIQDDWKVNRWLTIQLGLRNEYESAWHDPKHFFSRGLDLSQGIPEMQSNAPQMPAQATALMGGNFKYNGQWLWTDDEHPGMWDPQKLALAPRLGAAIKIDDFTALRIGYARYLTPTEMNLNLAPVSGFETVSFLEPPYFGMKGYQNAQGLIEGVPQQRFNDPFPTATNPLLPIIGKNYAGNLGRGGAPLLWYPRDLKKQRNDRFNVNFQRQLPGQIVASATWFMNIGNQHYTKALNDTNPQILEQQQQAVAVKVANPFFGYLNSQLFPGPSRNQSTVTVSSLLRQFPQYGGLYEVGTLGASERYHSLELKAQKAFSKGTNFLFAYVYIREKLQEFFNAQDTYDNRLTYINSNQPRHRITSAGTYELPFGAGRPYLTSMPKALDAVVGGWKITGLATFMSGSFLRFGNLIVNGDPIIDNPTPQKWFNTAAFSPLPPNTYVIRKNPWQYEGLTGPSYFMLDGILAKNFKFGEKLNTEFKVKAYNALNRLTRGDPNLNINSSQFGQALYQGTPAAQFGPQQMQLGNVSGRQVELEMRIYF